MRLDALVRARHEISWNQARAWIATGKIWLDGKPVTDPALPVDENAVLELKMNAPRPLAHGRKLAGPRFAKSDIIHLDEQVVVMNKPAGLSTVPFEKGEIALEQMLSEHLAHKVSVVHRLDRETSGLIVFALSHVATNSLSSQFREHSVQRRYLALAHGHVPSQTIRSALYDDRGDGLRGSAALKNPKSLGVAKPAVTHVKALALLSRGESAYSLVECRLETGRTHQIRIHLSEAGHPLLGEKAYVREYRGVKIEAPRLMLHAAELGFAHPASGAPMHWSLPPPRDFAELLDAQTPESDR